MNEWIRKWMNVNSLCCSWTQRPGLHRARCRGAACRPNRPPPCSGGTPTTAPRCSYTTQLRRHPNTKVEQLHPPSEKPLPAHRGGAAQTGHDSCLGWNPSSKDSRSLIGHRLGLRPEDPQVGWGRDKSWEKWKSTNRLWHWMGWCLTFMEKTKVSIHQLTLKPSP